MAHGGASGASRFYFTFILLLVALALDDARNVGIGHDQGATAEQQLGLQTGGDEATRDPERLDVPPLWLSRLPAAASPSYAFGCCTLHLSGAHGRGVQPPRLRVSGDAKCHLLGGGKVAEVHLFAVTPDLRLEALGSPPRCRKCAASALLLLLRAALPQRS